MRNALAPGASAFALEIARRFCGSAGSNVSSAMLRRLALLLSLGLLAGTAPAGSAMSAAAAPASAAIASSIADAALAP